MIRFVDLFAGIGGIRKGFELACAGRGLCAECVFTSEIKPHAVAVLLLALAATLPARAQMWDSLFLDTCTTDTAQTRVLGLTVEAVAFLRDNEYDGSALTNGYTLPGVRLAPRLTYDPIDHIHLELGAYAIFYDGAGKYPNYAFHDIATWKGQQYSRGVHALPFFRAAARLRHIALVFGDLYGAQNHRLIEPLYNPELNLTADPEMGFQLLLDRRHVHLDCWLDWQSYIYELDTHQEAFTVGTNATILWGGRTDRRLRWSTPVQMLIQHRGGEQDTTSLGVQTFANLSVGARLDCTPRRPHISALSAEANALVSYQQKGAYWPFDTGFAMHAAVGLTLWGGLSLRAGYLEAPRQFANLFGNPYLSTVSVKTGQPYRGMHTAYLRADYAYAFTPAYRLGAELEAISAHTPGMADFGFSFGVYLRVCPQFRIRSFGK